jgi:hypothetical protein
MKNRIKVLAFADNDAAKHGTKVGGIPVISPESLQTESFDGVVITSMYVEQIHTQLIDLGIPGEKIHVYGSGFRDTRPIFPWDAVLFLIFSVVSLIVTLIFLAF